MHDPYYSLLGSTCDYLHVNEFIKVLTLQISSDKFPNQCQILGNKFGMCTNPDDHRFNIEEPDYLKWLTLEESLSITNGRCDLAIATHARKMHKKIFVVVHPEVLVND